MSDREPDPPCSAWTPLLHALRDGELDAANSLRCEAHLAECAACAAAFDRLHAVCAVLSGGGIAWSAPAALRASILASLANEGAATARGERIVPAASDPRPGWWDRLRAAARDRIAVPAGLAFAASLTLAVLVTRPAEPVDLSNQIVAGHVRSLLADHLVDVRTSDQHTVKPWFNGRIDFSPPVLELADREFPLIGGRLDYIDNRVVAALIYMRRKHVINLFIWPSEPRRSDVYTKEGYTVLGWQQVGLTFWAVSDLGPVELKEFQDAFVERASP